MAVEFPKPNRFWKVHKWGRAVSYVFRRHAGVSVTVAGTVTGFGGILVGLGLFEISTARGHPSALANVWVRVGGFSMIVGIVLSLSVLVVLIVRRSRDEEDRKILAARHFVGTGYLRRVEQNQVQPAGALATWDSGNQDLLKRIDPTYGFLARYESDAGLPMVRPQGILANGEKFLHVRIARLSEFIAELER